MNIYLIKTLQGLKASDEESLEALKKFKIGDVIKAKVTKPRNYKFHKKYFAMINLVFENQEQYKTTKEFLEAIKKELGMYTTGKSFNGDLFPIFESISFAKMDDLRFSKFYNDTLNILSKFLGVYNEDLENEIINFM